MSDRNQGGSAEKKEESTPSLLLIILAFIFFWPLGVVLLFLRIKNEAKKIKGNTGLSFEEWTASRSQAAAAPSRAQSRPASAPKSRRLAAKNPMRQKKWRRRFLKWFGGFLTVTGAIALTPLLLAFFDEWEMEALVAIMPMLVYTLGGAAMLGKGISGDRAAQRYQKYLTVIGDTMSVPLRTLSQITGQPERRIADDLDAMIKQGYFGTEAYVDRSVGCLFLNRAAASAAMAAAIEETEEPPAPQENAEGGYAAILRNIRRANDRIDDEALSRKITRLEEVTAQIFRAIEEDESRRAQMHTFLEYYLPTTQKLLDSYAEFEEAGIEGENLRAAKEKIEETMDTIVAGFERQLDALYAADAMDIQADIDVMNTMLRRDGAMYRSDFQVTSGGAAAAQGNAAAAQELK